MHDGIIGLVLGGGEGAPAGPSGGVPVHHGKVTWDHLMHDGYRSHGTPQNLTD